MFGGISGHAGLFSTGIFDLHYTTKSTGTGIGLYLARCIVEAHGGAISVENRPGRGSEFRLRLPALGQGA